MSYDREPVLTFKLQFYSSWPPKRDSEEQGAAGIDSQYVPDVVTAPDIIRRINRQIMAGEQAWQRGGHQRSFQEACIKIGRPVRLVKPRRGPTLKGSQYNRQHRHGHEFDNNKLYEGKITLLGNLILNHGGLLRNRICHCQQVLPKTLLFQLLYFGDSGPPSA